MMAGILVVESTATRIHSSDGILGAQATRRPGSTQPPSSTAVQGPPVRWNQVLLALTNQSPWWRSRLDDLEFCTHDVAGRWCHLQELEPVFFKNISAYPKKWSFLEGSVQTSEKLKWLLKVPDLNESTSEVQQIMLESDVPNMIRTSAGVAHLRLQRLQFCFSIDFGYFCFCLLNAESSNFLFTCLNKFTRDTNSSLVCLQIIVFSVVFEFIFFVLCLFLLFCLGILQLMGKYALKNSYSEQSALKSLNTPSKW